MMDLPNPPNTYSHNDQVNLRSAIKDADAKNLKRGVTISAEPIYRTSPDGTVFVLGVSNAGVTTWTLAP